MLKKLLIEELQKAKTNYSIISEETGILKIKIKIILG